MLAGLLVQHMHGASGASTEGLPLPDVLWGLQAALEECEQVGVAARV